MQEAIAASEAAQRVRRLEDAERRVRQELQSEKEVGRAIRERTEQELLRLQSGVAGVPASLSGPVIIDGGHRGYRYGADECQTQKEGRRP